ncbi:WxL protein peptidoglycan domain-containing protein [Streptantibioticus rubrisoli]|uniref:DUF916 domain-containing protein n=1 Tax=Streptantibioticus rubrisoli TaxID=1387313 RepID=A0ABT1PG51_9ACTN|nr:DUF916 domain-containing protein [Streptantibioticus rubrisoli]MCQ4044352.1 hypothetical protein [Streptantibioticus rubrisoli]
MASPSPAPEPPATARRMVGAVIAVLAACVALGGWTAAPAGDRPYFYLETGPGTVARDTVSVANSSEEPERFTLQGVDAHLTAHGAIAVRDAADSSDSGTWTRFAASSIRVPARTRADIPFTVTVPGTAPPGDHPAAIVVEDGTGRRTIVPVRLRVTGHPLAALGVEDVAVARTAHGTEIRYVLANRGNTPLTPSVTVTADGLLGTSLHRQGRPPTVLPPGQRIRLAEPWPRPPALDRTRIRVTATAGGVTAVGTAGYAAVPWAPLGAVCAGVGCAGAALLVRRRRVPDGAAEDGQQGAGSGQLAGAAT